MITFFLLYVKVDIIAVKYHGHDLVSFPPPPPHRPSVDRSRYTVRSGSACARKELAIQRRRGRRCHDHDQRGIKEDEDDDSFLDCCRYIVLKVRIYKYKTT